MSAFVNRQNKSTLFAKIFGSPENKAYTLQLYNAMNGTHFDNPDDLILTTLETIVYMGMHNDVSFMLDCTMNLYEHQSTPSENMPVRFFRTLNQLYSAYISDTDSNLKVYREKALLLPAPRCIVFYNGKKEAPERDRMKLSDFFIDGKKGDVEVVVHFININKGNNEKLKKACKPLQQYCWFVDASRTKQTEGKSLEQAVDEAIDEMNDDWALKKYLAGHRAGVKEIMFDEKSIEEVREMVDKRIDKLEGEVSRKDALLNEKELQLVSQAELLNEKDQQLDSQAELIKEQDKNLSNAIAYVAKTLGISEKEAQELIASQQSQSE